MYKFINKDGSDSEDESNQERLNEVEQLITNYQLELSKLMIGRGELWTPTSLISLICESFVYMEKISACPQPLRIPVGEARSRLFRRAC